MVVFFHLNIRFFLALKWLKMSIGGSKCKFDLIKASFVRQINVDLMSVCRLKIYCVKI